VTLPLRPTVARPDLDPATVRAVTGLVERARQADSVGALNEEALLRLQAGSASTLHVLAYAGDDEDSMEGGDLVGYGQLDLSEPAAGVNGEVVVDPVRRREGWGTAVVSRALDEAEGSAVLLWSHGDHPGAGRIATRLGFARVRELWQMRRPLGSSAPLEPRPLPDGVSVRTFQRGRDEAAWLRLNARAFAAHPEQGGLDADDLAQRISSDWFDESGFFLAERAGRLVGAHWTKVHRDEGPAPVGEVYVVGVDPDEQGGGLGSALTAIGVQHLADSGLDEVLLYVEADNTAALAVYERLGFVRRTIDVQYEHPGREASGR
jgi:mycothiol synthase